jgi:hypothetical protein
MVMSLAQLVIDDPLSDYMTYIHRQQLSKYIIMDNGANEGAAISNTVLAQRAKLVDAHEVVLPDSLGNYKETLRLASAFIRYYASSNINYMGVVHGSTIQQMQTAIDMYATQPLVKTLGLPRMYVSRIDRAVRIDLANWIKETYKERFEIHLLGASASWIQEPYYANKYAGHIRSIDTSLPYNYAFAGVQINDTKRIIDRTEDYFTRTHVQSALTCIAYNEEVYRSWCNGTR